ncbi:hypothetical protein FACS1894201_06660 [Bacteroidia bacterium]|nr:hypothetical protein FACS1894201_06660 [Bacteroidia bacterium]
MNPVYLTMLLLLCCIQCAAQRPQWIANPPKPADTYYYRVAEGQGKTDEEAVRKAFIAAIRESSFAIGAKVNLSELERTPADSTLVMLASAIDIPINKVCYYAEPLITSWGYRAFVLCQVAKPARVKPNFKQFSCYLNREEE